MSLPSVFLSHSSADKTFARRLAKKLRAEEIYVWIDEVDLRIGESLVDRIAEAIDQTDYLLAIISSNSITSRWVQKELSLAMSKEIEGKSVAVLPVLIDNCEMPLALRDKLYADFRDRRKFQMAFNKLLKAMRLKDVITVDWLEEGPRLIGRGVVISATECNALMSRWADELPKFIEQEKKNRTNRPEDVWPAAALLACIRACGDTYNWHPNEEEIWALKTELSKKFNLFYLFIQEMEDKAGVRKFDRRRMDITDAL